MSLAENTSDVAARKRFARSAVANGTRLFQLESIRPDFSGVRASAVLTRRRGPSPALKGRSANQNRLLQEEAINDFQNSAHPIVELDVGELAGEEIDHGLGMVGFPPSVDALLFCEDMPGDRPPADPGHDARSAAGAGLRQARILAIVCRSNLPHRRRRRTINALLAVMGTDP